MSDNEDKFSSVSSVDSFPDPALHDDIGRLEIRDRERDEKAKNFKSYPKANYKINPRAYLDLDQYEQDYCKNLHSRASRWIDKRKELRERVKAEKKAKVKVAIDARSIGVSCSIEAARENDAEYWKRKYEEAQFELEKNNAFIEVTDDDDDANVTDDMDDF